MSFFHRLSLSTCIVAIPLLASCSNQNPPEVELAPPPLNSSNKLEVFPQESTSDSTQSLLGIREWKFVVDIPRTHKYLSYVLEVREKGKKPRVIYKAILGVAKGPQRRELKLAMLPLKFDWAKSEQVKKQLKLGGSMGSSEIDNPFKGCTMFSSGLSMPVADGSFLIMEGNTPEHFSVLGAGKGQFQLVLKLKSGSSAETLSAEL